MTHPAKGSEFDIIARHFGPLAAGVYTDPSDDFKTVFALGIDTRR